MIPESKWKQFGNPGSKIKGIIIHNTNNPTFSAEGLEAYLLNSKSSAGCHYIIDHKEIRQLMPDDWSVYNVGNGLAFGNLDCIAVEICSNPSTKLYLQGEARAINLIKSLMEKYHLTTDDVFFHRDFQPNINCPAQILKRYTKSEFLNLLKGEQNDYSKQDGESR